MLLICIILFCLYTCTFGFVGPLTLLLIVADICVLLSTHMYYFSSGHTRGRGLMNSQLQLPLSAMKKRGLNPKIPVIIIQSLLVIIIVTLLSHTDASCVQIGRLGTISGSSSFSVCIFYGQPRQHVCDAEGRVHPGAVSGYCNEAACQKHWS